MTGRTRSRWTAALAVALVVGFAALGGALLLVWEDRLRADATRSDVLGRERMLVVWSVDLADRVRTEGPTSPAAAELDQRLDLLVDQWHAVRAGGPERDLELRETGRRLEPWPTLDRFDDLEQRLLGLVADIRAVTRDGVPSKVHVAGWREDVDALVPDLLAVVRAASAVREVGTLALAGAAFACSLLTAATALTIAAGRRRRAEAAERVRADAVDAARTRFERIVHESPDDLLVFDARGELTWATSELGGTERPASADELRARVHPDDLARVEDAVRRCFSHPAAVTTASCRLADGPEGWRHVEVVCRNLLDDPVVDGVVLAVRDVTERHAAESALAELSTLQGLILDTLTEGVILTHRTSGVVVANRAAGQGATVHVGPQTGLEQVLGQVLQIRDMEWNLIGNGEGPTATVMRTGEPQIGVHLQLIWPNGRVQVNRVSAFPCRFDEHGEVELVLTTFSDVTEQLAVERTLADERRVLDAVLSTVPSGVVALHSDGRIRMVNRAVGELFGYQPVVGSSLRQLLAEVDLRADGGDELDLVRTVGELGPTSRIEDLAVELVDANGRHRSVLMTVAALDDGGAEPGALLSVSDVTALRRAERDLRRLATVDPLTGLPNRRELEARLAAALARQQRHPDHVTVLFVDLDGFKSVNDALGHGAGDELLVAVGRRLVDAVRIGDVVARIGGDEFVVLVERTGDDDPVDALRIAARIEASLAEPFHLAAGTASIGASVGVAVAGEDDSVSTVLSAADAGMYEAKRSHRVAAAR